MSSKRVRVILLTGAVLIALVIGISLILTFGSHKTSLAELPTPGTSASANTGPDSSAQVSGLVNVTLDTGNVQDVIATLKRPASYTRKIRVENFFEDTSTVYDIDASVTEDGTALKIDSKGIKKNIITAGDNLYIWYDGDKDYIVRPLDASGDTEKISDEWQMILTYKDVLSVDKSSILDADYAEYGGENCICVKFIWGTLKYVTTCYISAESGLLTGAVQYDGSALVYKMSTSDYTLTASDDKSAFDLPDGKNAFSAP
jgi:hypothetical protein